MLARQDSDHPIDKIRFGLMVAIGGEDAGETLELLKKQEAVARRELEQVPKRAEARGPEFVEFAQESMDDLVANTESYLRWLEKARTALEQQDSGATMEAYEESSEILPSLTASIERYSQDFSGYGPLTSPPGNTLVRTAEGIAAGELVSSAWTEYCEHFRRGIAEREATLATLELPGRTLLRNKYTECRELLDGFKKNAPASGQAAVESLTPFDTAYFASQELEQLVAAAAAGGATPIPATSVLLAFLENESKYSTDDILTVVEDYGEIMDGYSESFEQAVSRPSDSVLVQEEIPKTLDNLDAHYAAIEELGEALESSDQNKVTESLATLKATALALKESQEVYETAALHQSAITCPSCSRSNPPENRNCEACGEILPRSENLGAASSTFSVLSGPALEENQKLEMTENVAKLFQACDDVYAGQITPQQFLSEVEFARQGLNEFVEELEGVAATAVDQTAFTEEQWEIWQSQHLPHMEDVAVAYQAGIQEAQAGLATMEQYLEEPEQQHLIEGIRLTWQGLSSIHRARLSMEAYMNMLGDILQEARERGYLTEG